MATFNVHITSKAIKSLSNLNKGLVDAYRAFDPSTPASAIKVITHHLHNNTGNWLYVGGSGENEMAYRYIRVIIDVPAGSKTAGEKEVLLKRVLDCCTEYEGKKATGCEIEVRVNEVDQGNVMRINAVGVRN